MIVQDSAIVPLLFLISIDDIHTGVNHGASALFVDSIKIICIFLKMSLLEKIGHVLADVKILKAWCIRQLVSF